MVRKDELTPAAYPRPPQAKHYHNILDIEIYKNEDRKIAEKGIKL